METNITKKKRSLTALVMALAMVLSLFAGISFAPIKAEASGGTISGSGTQNDPYLIEDLADLNAFRTNVNGGNSYSGKFVKLTNDIDATGESWTPIAVYDSRMFSGTFDGDGHKITYQVSGDTTTVGKSLFHYISGGTVKNLIVSGSIEGSGDLYAGIAVYNVGTISNCECDVNITGSNDAGNYAGITCNNYGTVKYCVYSGTITCGGTGDVKIGGISRVSSVGTEN